MKRGGSQLISLDNQMVAAQESLLLSTMAVLWQPLILASGVGTMETKLIVGPQLVHLQAMERIF